MSLNKLAFIIFDRSKKYSSYFLMSTLDPGIPTWNVWRDII